MTHAKTSFFAIAVLSFLQVNMVLSQTNKAPFIPAIKSAEIVDCLFVTKYETDQYIYTENEPDKYRYAIVTARIQKAPGKELKIAAADITLHYYHGEYGNKEEVAPCRSISTFSKSLDVDRSLKKCNPGWIKRATGTRTTASSIVYIDFVFYNVESDISDMWLCLAKPRTLPYPSGGWKL